MPQVYEPEFKRKLVRLHLEEGRSYYSLFQRLSIGIFRFFQIFILCIFPKSKKSKKETSFDIFSVSYTKSYQKMSLI